MIVEMITPHRRKQGHNKRKAITTLIVLEHEFFFRFFSPDQLCLQSGIAFVMALLSPITGTGDEGTSQF